jgi:hypothetical protein
MFFCKEEFGLFGGIMTVMDWFLNVYTFCENCWRDVQSQFFSDYYMTLGVYNKDTQRYIKIYDYSWWFYTLFAMVKSYVVPKDKFLIPLEGTSLKGHHWVLVSIYFNSDHGYIEHCITYPSYHFQEKVDFNIIYAMVNDSFNLTKELENFKNCFIENRYLSTQDVVNILCHVSGKQPIVVESGFKILKDDSFNEIVFKENDQFKLYDGQ